MSKDVLAPVAGEKMIGTTGSKFNVVGVYPAGRVGFRNLVGGSYRIRVEPSNGTLPFEHSNGTLPFGGGWKIPSYTQNRYSTVVHTYEGLVKAVSHAKDILVAASPKLKPVRKPAAKKAVAKKAPAKKAVAKKATTKKVVAKKKVAAPARKTVKAVAKRSVKTTAKARR